MPIKGDVVRLVELPLSSSGSFIVVASCSSLTEGRHQFETLFGRLHFQHLVIIRQRDVDILMRIHGKSVGSSSKLVEGPHHLSVGVEFSEGRSRAGKD